MSYFCPAAKVTKNTFVVGFVAISSALSVEADETRKKYKRKSRLRVKPAITKKRANPPPGAGDSLEYAYNSFRHSKISSENWLRQAAAASRTSPSLKG